MAQLLGLNHDACGYPDARTMILAFKDMAAQVTALAKFIAANPVIADAIRRGDALSFARSWNGEGQPEQYAEGIGGYGIVGLINVRLEWPTHSHGQYGRRKGVRTCTLCD